MNINVTNDSQQNAGIDYNKLELNELIKLESKNHDSQVQFAIGKQVFYKNALIWIEKSANQGYAEAQNFLGNLCRTTGKYKEALGWLKKAANQNFANALFTLGEMYINGEGVKDNFSTAIEFFKKAATNGHKEAKKLLKQYEEKS